MRPGCSNTKRKNQYSMYYAITHVRKKMTSFNISLEDIKNLHNCSVCLTVPRSGHIFQCDNGHLHCSSCHQKLKNKICPVCRIRLRESRNLVAEQTIEKLPFKCKFEECNVELLKSEIDVHEKDCNFRLVQCVFLDTCQEKVPFNSIQSHIDHCAQSAYDNNNINSKYNEDWIECDFEIDEECFNQPNQTSLTELVKAHQHNFYVEIVRTPEGDSSSKGLWHFWVYFLGTKKEAQFWSDFKIKNLGNDEPYHTWRDKVVSIDTISEEILSSENVHCATFLDSMIRKFLKNGKLGLNVSIIPMKAKEVPKKSSTKNKNCNNNGSHSQIYVSSKTPRKLKVSLKGKVMEDLGSNVEGVYLPAGYIWEKPCWNHGDYIIRWCDSEHIRGWCIFEGFARCVLKATDEVSLPHEATNWIYYNRTTNVGINTTDGIRDGIRTTDVTISEVE